MIKKELNKRCLSNEECKSKLCFQGICTSKKSARIPKAYTGQNTTRRKEIQDEIKTKKERLTSLKTELGNAKKNLTEKNKELKTLKPKKNDTPKEKLDELETEIKTVKKTIKRINHLKSQQTQMLEALTRKNKKIIEKEKKKAEKDKKKEPSQTRKQREKRIGKKFEKEMKQLQELDLVNQADWIAVKLQ